MPRTSPHTRTNLTTTAGVLLGSAIAEGDERWRLFAEFGLPYAGGKLGKVPAQLIYWKHQLAAKIGLGRQL